MRSFPSVPSGLGRLTTLMLVGLLLFGCKKADVVQDESIPLESVPAAVMQTAREQLPEIPFQQAFKFEADGKVIYELRGVNAAGQVREVEVFASGELFQVE